MKELAFDFKMEKTRAFVVDLIGIWLTGLIMSKCSLDGEFNLPENGDIDA